MRRFWFCLALGMWAAGAHATDKPAVGPAESWVKSAPPTPVPPRSDVATRMLLLDEQIRFEPGGQSTFAESRVLVQTPPGLDAMGAVSLAWKPDTETLTIHKISILRGDKVIDLLKTQGFTVLRRETNLELAMLDGVLTATLQPEGLQVGDVLDVAYTLTEHDPVMGGRSEAWFAGLFGVPVDHLHVRALWAKPKAMRWRFSDGVSAPKVVRGGETTEVDVDMQGVRPEIPPTGAPARFLYGRELEFSEFASWADVAALFAPLYAKAEILTAGSPLKAEAAAIRATSADPKVQAALALALVQDKVRYVFLGMNDGGLAPADAGTTWARRFGDCKGKTALLIALLHELGIEAQPAVVSTERGDGLEARLPAIGVFDHILVRATIGGTVYWLDGTRRGDSSLAELAVPPFRWALPVQAAGASLIPLVQAPLGRAESILSLTLDASGGLDVPAPARARAVIRGDGATSLRLMLADLAPADFDRGLRAFWKKLYDYIEPKTVTASFDPASGEERMSMEGEASMAWYRIDGSAARRYEADGASLGWKADFKRDPGPHVDAPYAVDFPKFERKEETIKLPLGGAGFSVDGADVDLTAAGVNYVRKTSIDKGVFTLAASVRSVAPEFPASEAVAAAKTLTDMAAVSVYVRAPASYVATPADNARQLAAQPTTASAFLDRGNAFINLSQYDKAIADLDKAIALDPKTALAYSDRGVARFWNGDSAGAKADLDKATGLDPRDVIAFHGYGLLAAQDGRFADAAAFFSRAIDQQVDDTFAIASRASVWWDLGELDKALADSDTVLRLDPQRSGMRQLRASIYAVRKAPDREVAELDSALAADPTNPEVRLMRAQMFGNMGRLSDARKEVGLAIEAKPTRQAYLTRAFFRDATDVAGKAADIDAALKLEPNSPFALRARAQAYADAKNYAAAIAELSRDVAANPDSTVLFLTDRGKDFARSGDAARALKDFAAVRAKAAGNAEALNDLCWAQATIDFATETALDDCTAALKIAPKSAPILDSRAFVLLRLGRLDEALADYDAALGLSPHLAPSLFGRGLVKLKKGQGSEAQTDLTAARAITVRIDEQFADYGLRP